MEELSEHSVSLSPAQITKMKKGLNVTLAPHHFTEAGQHTITVMPFTHKRIMSSLRKGKGLKISLHPNEGLYKKTSGGKLSLKGIGRSLKHFGHQVEGGMKKVGKVVAKPMVDALIQGGIPALAGLSGAVLGGPAGGIAGEVAGQALAQYAQKEASKKGLGIKGRGRRGRPKKKDMPAGGDLIHIDLGSHNAPETEGKGLGRTLKKVYRKVKKPLKTIGKITAGIASSLVGDAIGVATGNPMLGEKVAHTINAVANKGVKKGLKEGYDMSKDDIRRLAVEQVDKYVDANLSGEQRRIAQDALAGKYKNAEDLIYDVNENVIQKELRPKIMDYAEQVRAQQQMYGGGANAYGSLAYKTAMKRINGGGIKHMRRPMVGGAVAEMTLSPYQSYSSPAMHPFIPDRNELQGYNPIKGGSIYAAGYKRGGSFVVAG